MSDIVAIIPNYNGGEELVTENLESLFTQTVPCRVIVVDNGSDGENLEVFKKFQDRIELIENGENLGFGRAINIGIRASGEPHIFLVNNDVVLEPDCLERLRATLLEQPKIGGVNSLMLRYDAPTVIDSAGIGFDRTFQHRDLWSGQGAARVGSDVELAGLCAGASMYRREYFDDVGLFDEAMFLVFEDVDISLRGLWRGWRYRLVASAKCRHHRNYTTRKLEKKVKSRSFDRVRSSRKYNHLRYLAKNMPLSVMLRKTLGLLNKDLGKLAKLDPTQVRAWRGYLADLGAILAERKRIKAGASISDREFLKLLSLND